MTTFHVIEIEPTTLPAEAWARLRAELVNAQSVELLVDDRGGFEVRVWWGERADGSNHAGAASETEY